MSENSSKIQSPETFVIGAGPAGIGLAVAADNLQKLDLLLRQGTVFADSGDEGGIGGGRLNYQIKSNSVGPEFVCLDEGVDGLLSVVRQGFAAQALLESGNNIVDLPLVRQYLRELGGRLIEVVQDFPNSDVLPNTTIDSVHREDSRDGRRFSVLTASGNVWRSNNVVLATGAEEQKIDLGKNSEKIILSTDVLTGEAFEDITERLIDNRGSEIVILGSSHSAFSAAWKLLEVLPRDLLAGGIKILHRSDIKLFYNSIAEAEADGYEFDPVEDVCLPTGKVFRYSGLRGNAKQLYKDVCEGTESRVKLQKYEGSVQTDAGASRLLDQSAVLIQAFGHKARKVPVFDKKGREIGPLLDERGKVEVDDTARVIGLNREIIRGLFALGLGHGRKPSEATGGERSAKNNPVDSINYFQDTIAKDILRQILKLIS
ncbi:MAG: hypothetical protein AAB373_05125 [Patescibacteria group bacterium]